MIIEEKKLIYTSLDIEIKEMALKQDYMTLINWSLICSKRLIEKYNLKTDYDFLFEEAEDAITLYLKNKITMKELRKVAFKIHKISIQNSKDKVLSYTLKSLRHAVLVCHIPNHSVHSAFYSCLAIYYLKNEIGTVIEERNQQIKILKKIIN